jgi:uncharacterized protein (TIGR03435 family)
MEKTASDKPKPLRRCVAAIRKPDIPVVTQIPPFFLHNQLRPGIIITEASVFCVARTMPNDHTLLLNYARSRDAEAFALLVERYSALVFSVAKRVTGNAATAEDVTQDCFFSLARHAAAIRGSLPGWLHRVALNRSLQSIREEARRKRHEAQVLPSTDVDCRSNWSQVVPVIDSVLAKLPDELRDPLVQHFLLGRTQAEVAEHLHINQSTVSRRLQEGIARLREHLRQAGVVCGAAALATALAENACAAVPAQLTASLAKMALAGPVTLPAAASTATAATHGALKSLLVKGAFVLMAMQNTKTAVVLGVGILLAATTATVVCRRPSQPQVLASETQEHPWQTMMRTWNYSQEDLEQIPPQVKIVPTIFPSSRPAYRGLAGKYLGMAQPIESLVLFVLDTRKCRVISEAKGKPEGRYDFIANLPTENDSGNREAIQREIERQFHLTVQKERRMTDVLVLTVIDQNRARAAGRKRHTRGGIPCIFWASSPCHFSRFLVALEEWVDVPVVDRTGLADELRIQAFCRSASLKQGVSDGLKKALSDELGMALVPSREIVEMFVVKDIK